MAPDSARHQTTAAPSLDPAQAATQRTLLDEAEKVTNDFLKADKTMRETVKKFVTGEEKDVKRVIATIRLWAAAKLEFGANARDMVATMHKLIVDGYLLQTTPGFFEGVVLQGRARIRSQADLIHTMVELHGCARKDDDEVKLVCDLIREAEEEFARQVNFRGTD